MKIILDTSSIFYGFLPDSSNEYMTTESVLEEIKGKGMKATLEMRIPFIKLEMPTNDAVSKVRYIARETGDLDHLSTTDIEIIALALQVNGTVLSNDLAIQNVCRKASVGYISFKGKEIRKEIKWKYRCIGCGKIYESDIKICPHCGSELKRIPSRSKVIH